MLKWSDGDVPLGPLAAATAAAMAAFTAGLCKSAGWFSLVGLVEFRLSGLNKKALELEDMTIGLEVALDFMF